jgi:indolepyruvate ferredoxin oxidoreductase beta subunit
MKQDIILAGVGGQGILSIAFVIDNAALADGLQFKQAEVHGMSQRGGAVQSHLRLSSERIWSDLVPRRSADLILSVEPLETLRYLDYLKPEGTIVTSATPFKNIPDYPDLEKVLAEIRRAGRAVIVDAERLAKEAGTSRPRTSSCWARFSASHPQRRARPAFHRGALQSAGTEHRGGQPQGVRPGPPGVARDRGRLSTRNRVKGFGHDHRHRPY